MNSEPVKRYYAHGKLIISGEYLVLRGATALAVPLKQGQHMEVEILPSKGTSSIEWNAGISGKPWFSATILMPHFRLTKTSDIEIAGRLIRILQTVARMNPSAFPAGNDCKITTHSEFDHAWGFGSSSALLANISRFASVDPFELCALIVLKD